MIHISEETRKKAIEYLEELEDWKNFDAAENNHTTDTTRIEKAIKELEVGVDIVDAIAQAIGRTESLIYCDSVTLDAVKKNICIVLAENSRDFDQEAFVESICKARKEGS